MKQLKINRHSKNKVTVIISSIDWDLVPEEGPHNGCFPTEYEYWQFDSIEEFIKECQNEDRSIFVEEIEDIYIGSENVTDKFLIWKDAGIELKSQWINMFLPK